MSITGFDCDIQSGWQTMYIDLLKVIVTTLIICPPWLWIDVKCIGASELLHGFTLCDGGICN